MGKDNPMAQQNQRQEKQEKTHQTISRAESNMQTFYQLKRKICKQQQQNTQMSVSIGGE